MARQSRLPDLGIVLEVRNVHKPGHLGRIFTVVGEEGDLIGDITANFVGKTHSIREVTVSVLADKDELVPSPFYPDVHHAVIKAVKKTR